jgi:large subunit ribosomal protein L5
VEKEKFFMSSRLRTKYDTELKESVKKELGISNPMAVPRLEKIVINMGLGEATQNVKIMDPLLQTWPRLLGKSR